MSEKEIADQAKKQLEEVVDFYKNELKNIRTGRANSALIEDLKVSYYGVPTPLSQMATVSVSDARTLVISPWGKDSLVEIEKAIKESDLNVNPMNDGNVIRLNFPALTEDRRKELVKLIGKKAEEARIKVRQIREDIWSDVQRKEKNGEISEDDKFRQKEVLQEKIDQYNKIIEELADKKEEELMQV